MTQPQFTYPPWTFEQVLALNDRQNREGVPAATCRCGAVLRASPRGWRCDDEGHARDTGERVGRVVRAWADAEAVEVGRKPRLT